MKKLVAISACLLIPYQSFAKSEQDYSAKQLLSISTRSANYCPTANYDFNDELKKLGKMAGIFYPSAFACVLLGPICMAGALLYSPIHILNGVRDDKRRLKAWEATEKTCTENLDSIEPKKRALWANVCSKAVFSANYSLLDKDEDDDGQYNIKTFPVKLSDNFTSRYNNGKVNKSVLSLATFQNSLRKDDYKVCLSDSKYVKKIEKADALTIKETIDMLVENIGEFGGKLYFKTEKLDISTDANGIVRASRNFLRMQKEGIFDGFFDSGSEIQLTKNQQKDLNILIKIITDYKLKNGNYARWSLQDLQTFSELMIQSINNHDQLVSDAKIIMAEIDEHERKQRMSKEKTDLLLSARAKDALVGFRIMSDKFDELLIRPYKLERLREIENYSHKKSIYFVKDFYQAYVYAKEGNDTTDIWNFKSKIKEFYKKVIGE